MYDKLVFINNSIEKIGFLYFYKTYFCCCSFAIYCKIIVFYSYVFPNLIFFHSGIDISEQLTLNRSKPEEITLRDDYGNDLLFQAGSFGENI